MNESWFQKHWRPMLMIIFTVLITAHWFGLTANDIPESVQGKMLTLITVLGGIYVGGRSAEKIVNKLK